MSQSTVDFIVPVASDSVFIEEAVSSIRYSIDRSGFQEYCNIIVASNAVKDLGFEAKLERISVRFGVECVVFGERLPIYRNWNRCLQQGSADFVHFVHDDDLLAPQYVSHLFERLPGKRMVLSSYTYFDNFKFGEFYSGWIERNPFFSSNEDFLVYLLSNFFHVSAVCFRRDNCGEFSSLYRFNSDQDFIRRNAYKAGLSSVGFLSDSPLVYIRSHSNQDQKQNNVHLHAAQNLCCINSRMIKHGLDHGLSPKLLGHAFSKTPLNSLRALSSYSLDWPIAKTVQLYYFFIRSSSGSFQLCVKLAMRIAFQHIVWQLKLRK